MKTCYNIILIFLLALFGNEGWGQVSYLGLNGGLEGSAAIDNTTINTLPQANTWTKANATQTIANETSTLRSGANSLKINNSGSTGRRVWSPLISVASTTSALTIQYYRYVANITNGQENQEGIYRDPAAEALQGTYNTPASASTWEKQTYSPASATFTSISGVIMHRILGTGGDMFIDDMCIYTGGVDVAAPGSPTASSVTNPTASTLDVSWTAPGTGVDGGGYLVVRGTADPTTVPNPNGIYAVGNTISTGTVAYQGTSTGFTDNGLASSTTYYYRIYTYDKAYNYSTALTGNGTISGGNSTSSDIIANAAFTYPTNIAYASYQSTNIVADANDIEVAKFDIRDGGGAADGDALSTSLTAITFSVTNSANLRRVAIYDGVTEIAELAAGASVVFTGLSGLSSADNGSKTFSIRASFLATVTDNQQFQFTVTSATADGAGSTFAAADAGGAVSSITGDNNRIEVTATQLSFVQQPSNTAVNAVMSPSVTVEAKDANNNRDLDFTSQIRITSTGTLTGTPVDVAASSGLATFSTLTHTATGTGLTLNTERQATLDWDITSSTFDITASGPILTFDFAGLAGNEASANSNFNDARLSSSTITRGELVSANANADRFNSSAWTMNPAYDADDFVEFTVSPLENKKFSITNIVIQHQRSLTGPVTFALRSNQDNYSSVLGGEQTIPDNDVTQTTTFTFSMTDKTADVTFRIYGYSSEAGTGTWGPGDGTGDDIVVNGNTADNPSTQRYYRSFQTGNWNLAATWEDSDDNGVADPWAAAASFPTYNDYAITIRTPHTVTIVHSPLTINETTIEAGATLVRTGTGVIGDIFIINNGTGDDLIIYGTYRHNDGEDGKHTGTGTVRVKPNGIIEAMNNSQGTVDYYAEDENVAFAATIIWESASVFKWSTTVQFSNSQRTYFPNVTGSVYPVLQINANNIEIGTIGNSTTVNGVFEVTSGNTFIWGNSGTKYFRNGFKGSGNIEQKVHASADQRCGPFIISGNGTISGTGTISLNRNNLEIASGTTTTLTSDKIINDGDGNPNNGTILVNGVLDASTFVLSGSAEFSLNSGGTLITANTLGVNGSITVTGTKTFDIAANYTFNGTANQVTGALMGTTANNVTISNTATFVSLTQATTVNGTLTLSDGTLITTSANLLTLTSGAAVSPDGGQSTSFVDGPIAKTGTTAFVFPVGDGTMWRRIGIGIPTASVTFTAEFVNATYGDMTILSEGVATLDNVDANVYWNLTEDIATVDATVTLYWEDATAEGIDDCADLCIAHFNGSDWHNPYNGNFTTTGLCTGSNSGTIATTVNVTDFSPFKKGSKDGGKNPLPITLLFFDAVYNGKDIDLTWTTASETNNDYFTVERAPPPNSLQGGDLEFTLIGMVKGAGNSNTKINYTFVDDAIQSTNQLIPTKQSGQVNQSTILYYRLKQTDFDARYEYFGPVAVEIPFSKTISVYPNPVKDEMVISINGMGDDEATIKIYDITGRVVYSRLFTGSFTAFIFNANRFPPGIYHIAITSERNGEGMRFVKE